MAYESCLQMPHYTRYHIVFIISFIMLYDVGINIINRLLFAGINKKFST